MDEKDIEEFANKIKDWYAKNGVEISIVQAHSISEIDLRYHVIGMPGFAANLLRLILLDSHHLLDWEKIID